jgi:hypothetical protein
VNTYAFWGDSFLGGVSVPSGLGGYMPITDVFAPINSAIALTQKVMTLAEKAKNAELHSLVSDLKLQLSEVKARLANVIDENTQLKNQVSAIGKPVLERCPACGRNAFAVVSSRPDADFGDMGVSKRIYECSECKFTESRNVH